ncbi:MAG: DNA internalization-related competence protein ComEC/Rec2 [Dechloromonas sp.]|uniref:DNA internalization-related competence protein ComEC/Rec2 n=1 Tax=Candidatus Dechloromonas phosphorivorans TaxID=2899244 RepID=A0A935JYR2_9RHOO|nr:DNA internalization-related competence protein ComEC/Rec2 [Candidatus Dechloromonas phosphorivorans]
MRLNILAFAAGILLLQWQPALPSIGAWLMLGGLLLLLAWRWPTRSVKALALLGCFLFGFGFACWRAEIRLADELPTAWEGRDIELVGVVASLPQDFSHGTRFEFEVEKTLTTTAVVPPHIMLSWYQGRGDEDSAERLIVKPGERWKFTTRLKRPHGNANPKAFDYEVWLLERGIRASGYIRANPPQLLADMVWSPNYLLERLRFKVRERLLSVLPAETYPLTGILVALAIGDQKSVNGDLWTTFNRTSTTHLFSVSGSHITLVAALFAGLVGWVWRRVPVLALRLPAQRVALLAGCLMAFIYVFLAGFGVPAQRTLYMLLVAALAVSSGRILAPSRILCLALLVVLLIDPWAVLAAGFWLSFGAVGALLYVGSALVGEGRGWRDQVRAWGVLQWTATLASLPVLLLIFQQFSLVSPLANALAIPVITFIVTPLALLGAVLPWWPILLVAHTILGWLMIFLEWCAVWPVWQIPAPPLWAAVTAAIGVAICLLPRGMAGRGIGLVMLVPVVFWPVAHPPEGSVQITVLDVGQGLSAVIQTHAHTLIYDPGPLYSAESDAGQRVVVPYLRTLGVNQIDMLMVTHRDSDHAGGLASVQSALAVDEVRSSMPEIPGQRCESGQRWVWDGVTFEVLHPSAEAYEANPKSNHLSCVLMVEAGGRRMLLTSDIEAPDEVALLARHSGKLTADVLLVPHHGSRTSSTPAFIEAVGARDVLIPVGYRNRFGHPKAEIVARYETAGPRIWRTDRDGALSVALGEEKIELSAWRIEHKRYWQGR